jgi:hypothetical protein
MLSGGGRTQPEAAACHTGDRLSRAIPRETDGIAGVDGLETTTLLAGLVDFPRPLSSLGGRDQ